MSEIKPDTSLYSTMPDKLRALAMIIESQGNPEVKGKGTLATWKSPNHEMTHADWCAQILVGGEARIKPKPRELWAPEFEAGLGATWDTAEEARASDPDAIRIVRFVEQPE